MSLLFSPSSLKDAVLEASDRPKGERVLDLRLRLRSAEHLSILAEMPEFASIEALKLSGRCFGKLQPEEGYFLSFLWMVFESLYFNVQRLDLDGLWLKGQMAKIASFASVRSILELSVEHAGFNKEDALCLARSRSFPSLRHLGLNHNVHLGKKMEDLVLRSPFLSHVFEIVVPNHDRFSPSKERNRKRTAQMWLSPEILESRLDQEPANLFLLSRLFLERGVLDEKRLFAAALSLSEASPFAEFRSWLEWKAEGVSDKAVFTALGYFPQNAVLLKRSSPLNPPDFGVLESALFS